ncbi:hypothetical protein DPMN_112487 [Dreissena polymorpha]|uniref:Uncharacterized protein n=1 Tax=Dreissena polymorpha TaxID=45954 RepID=A0A9D4KGE0_DREPO|nr:hypothetical protein DPMN_112487 [Dreissena polymorpha]
MQSLLWNKRLQVPNTNNLQADAHMVVHKSEYTHCSSQDRKLFVLTGKAPQQTEQCDWPVWADSA